MGRAQRPSQGMVVAELGMDLRRLTQGHRAHSPNIAAGEASGLEIWPGLPSPQSLPSFASLQPVHHSPSKFLNGRGLFEPSCHACLGPLSVRQPPAPATTRQPHTGRGANTVQLENRYSLPRAWHTTSRISGHPLEVDGNCSRYLDSPAPLGCAPQGCNGTRLAHPDLCGWPSALKADPTEPPWQWRCGHEIRAIRLARTLAPRGH